ncbi:MAG: D-alanyl-D-alanine carboxypeptidase [Firmicutes bacterium]|nr:D-alanyl-D-alanine carboxypeptidase [Bacillota bacterium]
MIKLRNIIIFLLLLNLWPQAVWAADVPALDAEAYVLMAADSGEILAASNADAKRYPASTTKIMTMVLALEAVARGEAQLDDIVTTSEYAASMGGSQVYLYPGETRTLEEMLIAVAVGSGNDASVAVAEHIGGTMGSFVEMMNKRAAELGMTGTHYANPHGLHDAEHYTTAADMAKLAHHAISVPGLLDYTGIYEYQFRGEPKPLVLWNTNRLLKWYDGTDGLKTGYTSEAGRNLVATAKRGDMRLISVVMGVVPVHGHFTESMELLNYGFNNYAYQLLYPAGQAICAVPVAKGAADTVDAVLQNPAGVLSKLGEGGEFTTEIKVTELPTAPITAGQQLGELQILKDGQIINTLPLLAESAVEKMSLLQGWRQIIGSICSFNY